MEAFLERCNWWYSIKMVQGSAQKLLCSTELTYSTGKEENAAFFLTRLWQVVGKGAHLWGWLQGVHWRGTACCLFLGCSGSFRCYCTVRCSALALQQEASSAALLSWVLLCPSQCAQFQNLWWACLTWLLSLAGLDLASAWFRTQQHSFPADVTCGLGL